MDTPVCVGMDEMSLNSGGLDLKGGSVDAQTDRATLDVILGILSKTSLND